MSAGMQPQPPRGVLIQPVSVVIDTAKHSLHAYLYKHCGLQLDNITWSPLSHHIIV